MKVDILALFLILGRKHLVCPIECNTSYIGCFLYAFYHGEEVSLSFTLLKVFSMDRYYILSKSLFCLSQYDDVDFLFMTVHIADCINSFQY